MGPFPDQNEEMTVDAEIEMMKRQVIHKHLRNFNLVMVCFARRRSIYPVGYKYDKSSYMIGSAGAQYH